MILFKKNDYIKIKIKLIKCNLKKSIVKLAKNRLLESMLINAKD